MHRPGAKRVALIAVRWILSLAALGIVLAQVVGNVDELRTNQLRFDAWWLAASFAALVVYLIGRALAWHDITRRNGVAIRLRWAVGSWAYSVLGKYLPGKVFLLLARMEAYRLEGRSSGRVTFAFFQETITSLLSSVLTVLAALLVADYAHVRPYRLPLAVGLVAVAIGMHPRILEPLLNTALRIVRREPVTLDLRYRDVVWMTLVQTGVWLIFGVAFFLFINAVHAVPLEQILFLAAAISLASLIGILALFAPAGLGVREGLLTVMLSDIMPTPLAAFISLASRVWVTIGELAIVAAGAVISRDHRRRTRLAAERTNSTVG